jgi:subtilase family serine protease
VSAVADPRTGVAVYVSIAGGTGQWLQIGGTSLAAPIWAATVAVTDGERAAAGRPHLASADGSVFTAIYSLGTALSDVTTGSNGPCPAAICTAHAGYDTVTGLGGPAAGVDTAVAIK